MAAAGEAVIVPSERGPPPADGAAGALAAHRRRVGEWLERPLIRNGIIALIVLNAATLGLETYDAVTERFGRPLGWLNAAVVAVFVAEIALRLFAQGARFFRSGWNVFDLAIVGVALLPDGGPFSVLRSLRILRVLRLLSAVARLRRLVEALLSAVPSIGWVGALLGLFFYVYAVMGTELFGARFPDWFGTLGASLYTLFQIMTLESWSMGVARPVMDVYPFAWLYFVSFILVSAFTVLNLFIGIIVSALQAAHGAEEESHRRAVEGQAEAERAQILAELRRLNERLERLAPSSQALWRPVQARAGASAARRAAQMRG